MDNREMELLQGFYNPIDLLDKADLFKRLSSLPPKTFFNILYETRVNEIEQLKLINGFYELEKKTILDNMLLSNLKDSLSDQEAEKLMEYLLNDSSIWLYMLFIQLEKETLWDEHIVINNISVLDKALAEGKGAILGQLHCGPFQLLAPILVKMKYPLLQMFGEKAAEEWAENLLHKFIGEDITYSSVTVPENGFLIKALKSLKRNKIVALPLEISGSDIKPEQKLNFLGKEIYAPDGACSIAAITKSPIIIVKLEAVHDKLEITFNEPIYIYDRNEVNTINSEIFKVMEQEILKTPLQWRGWGFFNEMISEKSTLVAANLHKGVSDEDH